MTSGCHEPGGRRGLVANLSIELTTRCNCACTHCFTRADYAQDACLDLDLVKAITREGYAEGYRHLHLTGGEPLLWPGLLGLLDDVFVQGYQAVFLNTNGLLMTDAMAAALARYPNLAISVSLQGPASLHDRMRGTGSYRQASRGIAAARDAGLAVTLFAATGKTLLAPSKLPVRQLMLKKTDGVGLSMRSRSPVLSGGFSHPRRSPWPRCPMINWPSLIRPINFLVASGASVL